MIRSTVLALLLAVACGACAIGPTVESHGTARGPGGSRVTLRLPRTQVVDAELLSVQDSAVLVRLRVGGLAAIHFADLRAISFEGFGSYETRGSPPSPSLRRRWTALSRFPQGLPPDQLARLLEASGRAEVERIR